MEFLGGVPVELDVLKPYITSQEKTSVGLLLSFNWDKRFEKMLMTSKRMSISLESTRQYVATHTVVKREHMDESWKGCYLRLLGMAASLEWTGLVSRRPVFKTSPSVQKIKEILPQITPDGSLVESLNADTQLTDLIHKVRPDTFMVELSLSTEGLPLGIGLDSVLSLQKEITWAVIVERFVTRGIGAAGLVMSIVDMIDLAMGNVVEASTRVRGAQ